MLIIHFGSSDIFLLDLKVHSSRLLCEMLPLRECPTLWNRTLSCSVQPVLWGKACCVRAAAWWNHHCLPGVSTSIVEFYLKQLVHRAASWAASSLKQGSCQRGKPQSQAWCYSPMLWLRKSTSVTTTVLSFSCFLSFATSERGAGGFRSDFWKGAKLLLGGCYTDLRVAQAWYVLKLEGGEEKSKCE